MVAKIVLVETIEVKGLSSLRIRKIEEVTNKEKKSSPDKMIPLHVKDVIRGILVNM